MDFIVTSGSLEGFPGTRHFIDSLPSTLDNAGLLDFFSANPDLIISRAPGRLDVMGGIADYSGSLVLQLPIADATHVALQVQESNRVCILSLGETSDRRFIELDLSEFLSSTGEPIEYSEARQRFSTASDHWAAYAAGNVLVLMRERSVGFTHGANILIQSSVPEGKGVSSSAAIEVAVMQALNVAFDLRIAPQELALLCQKTENLIAGAPCGIMDQMSSVCGEADQLLQLLCQPANLKGTLALPDELEVWGIDSGVRHSVGGSDYGTVRTAAFMGYRIIAAVAGLRVVSNEQRGRVHIDDPKWGGYLANIEPEEFERNYSSALPQEMRGDEFLDRYSGITDHVTSVNSEVMYAIRVATKHPIYEHARVRQFGTILKRWGGVEDGPRLGELMFQSHLSYTDCGLGSQATDAIVKLVRDLSDDGLFGARITGGGSGGTVAVLGRRGSQSAIEKLRHRFQIETGHLPLVISGSSAGASIFDHLKVRIHLRKHS
jgi:galactokinase